MKLPVDSVGQGDGPSDTENGGGGGGGGVEVQANGPAATNGSGAAAEPDFSEYLWMEHEEEFDEQVMRELEDEEMLHYYYDQFEEATKLGNTSGSSSSNNHANSHHHNSSSHHRQEAPSNGCPPQSFRGSGPRQHYQRPPGDSNNIEELTGRLDRVSFSVSRLNPNAAEFVPTSSQPPSVRAQDKNEPSNPTNGDTQLS